MTKNQKHTPGPWDYVEGKTLFHVEVVGGQGAICSIPKSREPDARLISAAPDLLYQLRAIIGLVDEKRLGMLGQAVMSNARAAIAKAEEGK